MQGTCLLHRSKMYIDTGAEVWITKSGYSLDNEVGITEMVHI